MILESLFESHVTSIFVQNIYPKLKFIALDYMISIFTKIIHRLSQKDKCLVDMGSLKYGNPSIETNGGRHQKKEDKEDYAIEEPSSKENQKS